jgi:carbonic anhydrase
VHHTDCGSALLADDTLRKGFAEAGGYDEVSLAALAVTEPRLTARADVEALLASPMVDDRVAVSGYVYDLATGLVDVVATPRRRADHVGDRRR